MLAKFFRKLLGHLDSREPAPWWVTAYDQAATDGKFGPAEKSELDSLVVDLQRHFQRPHLHPFWLEYTTLHGYLCCIVIGPPRLPAKNWLCELLGPLPEEPTPELLRLLALMRRLAADIENDFRRPKPQLRLPAIDVSQGPPTKTPGPKLLPLKYWCAAFLLATELQPTRWARLGPANNDTGDLLELLWTYGSPEGRQDQIEDAYRCYREDGYGETKARDMVQRFLLLLSTHRNMLAGLRRDLKEIWTYWR